MASWLVSHGPWSRSRFLFRWNTLAWMTRPTTVNTKYFFSTPATSEETPSMIAIRQEPYPQAGLDLDIFEDNLQDYGVSQVGYPEVAVARNPCHVLAQLVRDQNFEDAQRVYDDLMTIGVDIELDFVYQVMAQRAFSVSSSREQRAAELLRWWSLIPPASHPKAKSQPFGGIMHAVYSKSAVPDIPLAIQFALASAAKGYGPIVAAIAIPLIVRYAPPSTSLAFLREFRDADAQYQRDHVRGGKEVPVGRYKSMYGVAVRTHCMAARLDAAADVLRSATSQGIPVTRFTAKFLQDYLRSSGSMLSDHVSFKVARAQPEVTIPVPPASAPSSTVLRYLKDAFTKEASVSTTVLSNFFNGYKRTGRKKALLLLRRRIYRHAKRTRTIEQWVLAEMLYHISTSSRRGAFLSFAHHFHAVGIPIRAAKFMDRIPQRPQRFSDARSDWEFVEPVVSPKYPLRSKLWPSSHHTALIWRMVVQGIQSEDEDDIRMLYDELLAHVKLARNPDGVTDAGDMVSNPLRGAFDSGDISQDPLRQASYTQAVPSTVQFDSAHFNVFIEAWVSRKRISEAQQVLRDMMTFGIDPSVETFTLLATGFARIGDLEKVDALLLHMEEAHAPTTSVEQRKQWVVHPTEVTYTAVIRSLMNKGLYAAALEVAKRLYIKYGYVSGTNPITDAVLRELVDVLDRREGT